MRARVLRRIALFVLTLLLAGNVAAAAHACIEGLASTSHGLPQTAVAGPEGRDCASAGATEPGTAGCDQGHRNDDPKFTKDPPTAIARGFAPVAARDWREPAPVIASIGARPLSGPPLTILFGNLRF